MSDPKLHHYVPRFLLYRFAKDDQIELVHRGDLKRSFPISVEKALAENYFYSIDTDAGRSVAFEKMLDGDVESPASIAIRRVVDDRRSQKFPALRLNISRFLAFQFVRGPGERNASVEFMKATARKVASLATPELVQKTLREFGDSVSDEEAREIADFGKAEDLKVDISHKANLHVGNIVESASDFVRFFAMRTWILLDFDAPLLVTGDEPIGLIGSDLTPGQEIGLAGAEELVFAADPCHALVMVRPDIKCDESRIAGTPEMAAVINAHVAFGCHRFIVRYPGTDPLRELHVPEKADPVVTVGDYVFHQSRVSVAERDRWLKNFQSTQKEPLRKSRPRAHNRRG